MLTWQIRNFEMNKNKMILLFEKNMMQTKHEMD
jgi:hypothetical protein